MTIYDEIIAEMRKTNWYDATVAVMAQHYPNINRKEIEALAQRHGVHPPRGSGCGYQGSLSPWDYEGLIAELDAHK